MTWGRELVLLGFFFVYMFVWSYYLVSRQAGQMHDELYHALVDPGIKGESSLILPTYLPTYQKVFAVFTTLKIMEWLFYSK